MFRDVKEKCLLVEKWENLKDGICVNEEKLVLEVDGRLEVW